jgi:hypothetical protein
MDYELVQQEKRAEDQDGVESLPPKHLTFYGALGISGPALDFQLFNFVDQGPKAVLDDPAQRAVAEDTYSQLNGSPTILSS